MRSIVMQVSDGEARGEFLLCCFGSAEEKYVSAIGKRPLLDTVDQIGRARTTSPRRVVLVDLATREALYADLSHPATPDLLRHGELNVRPLFWTVLLWLKNKPWPPPDPSPDDLTAEGEKWHVQRGALIEAMNGVQNWGKFLIHAVPGIRGTLVVDLQTREGALFDLGDESAGIELAGRRVWVCPLFEPFLEWLRGQTFDRTAPAGQLPAVVNLLDARFLLAGHRRRGGAAPATEEPGRPRAPMSPQAAAGPAPILPTAEQRMAELAPTLTVSQIAKRLKEEGYDPPGHKWHYHTVRISLQRRGIPYRTQVQAQASSHADSSPSAAPSPPAADQPAAETGNEGPAPESSSDAAQPRLPVTRDASPNDGRAVPAPNRSAPSADFLGTESGRSVARALAGTASAVVSLDTDLLVEARDQAAHGAAIQLGVTKAVADAERTRGRPRRSVTMPATVVVKAEVTPLERMMDLAPKHTYKEIAAILTEEGVTPGKVWDQTGVRLIMERVDIAALSEGEARQRDKPARATPEPPPPPSPRPYMGPRGAEAPRRPATDEVARLVAALTAAVTAERHQHSAELAKVGQEVATLRAEFEKLKAENDEHQESKDVQEFRALLEDADLELTAAKKEITRLEAVNKEVIQTNEALRTQLQAMRIHKRAALDLSDMQGVEDEARRILKRIERGDSWKTLNGRRLRGLSDCVEVPVKTDHLILLRGLGEVGLEPVLALSRTRFEKLSYSAIPHVAAAVGHHERTQGSTKNNGDPQKPNTD